MNKGCKRFVLGLCLGFASTVFGTEAPVVDITQDVASAQQAETGAVTSDNPANTNTGSNTSAWQPVSTSDNNTATTQTQSANAQSSAQQSAPQQEWHPASGPIDQRMGRVEQQVSNLTQMNLPQQVTDLQQKVSDLQGKLDVADHRLQTLQTQQKTFYSDLSQRISKNGGASSNTSTGDQPAAATESSAPDDAQAYGKAFELLSKKQYEKADGAFNQYLSTYPKGRFAVNAHFWIGEIALSGQKYTKAKSEFETIVTDYPKSNKVPDAKLKLAMIDAATGNADAARQQFTAIKKDYPGTTAAQLATIRLQQLSE